MGKISHFLGQKMDAIYTQFDIQNEPKKESNLVIFKPENKSKKEGLYRS